MCLVHSSPVMMEPLTNRPGYNFMNTQLWLMRYKKRPWKVVRRFTFIYLAFLTGKVEHTNLYVYFVKPLSCITSFVSEKN